VIDVDGEAVKSEDIISEMLSSIKRTEEKIDKVVDWMMCSRAPGTRNIDGVDGVDGDHAADEIDVVTATSRYD